MTTSAEDEFTAFFGEVEARLRLSLVGPFGFEAGRDAAAEALAWAWQHWDRVRDMRNPAGYLYRVGRTSALSALGRESASGSVDGNLDPRQWESPNYEPKLAAFLTQLPENQRVAVWMVHGLGFSHREVAELLDCSKPTVATHVRRGLGKLRLGLGVTDV